MRKEIKFHSFLVKNPSEINKFKMLVRALLLVLAVAAARCDVEVKTYPGKPVAIWSYSTGELELNTEQLDGIFGHEALAGRKIVAYSIDGDKHEGKTFFMDYVLRYMYNTVSFIELKL